MDVRTEDRQADLEALRAEVERLRAEQQRFRAEVDRELVRRAFKIAELERALHEASVEYQSTLSWRVTQPLRALKALLTRR
jgi:phage gp36-like protein